MIWIHFQNIDTKCNGHPEAHGQLDLACALNVLPG